MTPYNMAVDVTVSAAKAAGDRLASLAGVLIEDALQAYDEVQIVLRDAKAPHLFSVSSMFGEHLNRMGAEHWKALLTRFRDPPSVERMRSPDAAE